MKMKGKKKLLAGVRIPLPQQLGGPQSSKKGARGYDRKREKQEFRREKNW